MYLVKSDIIIQKYMSSSRLSLVYIYISERYNYKKLQEYQIIFLGNLIML